MWQCFSIHSSTNSYPFLSRPPNTSTVEIATPFRVTPPQSRKHLKQGNTTRKLRPWLANQGSAASPSNISHRAQSPEFDSPWWEAGSGFAPNHFQAVPWVDPTWLGPPSGQVLALSLLVLVPAKIHGWQPSSWQGNSSLETDLNFIFVFKPVLNAPTPRKSPGGTAFSDWSFSSASIPPSMKTLINLSRAAGNCARGNVLSRMPRKWRNIAQCWWSSDTSLKVKLRFIWSERPSQSRQYRSRSSFTSTVNLSHCKFYWSLALA